MMAQTEPVVVTVTAAAAMLSIGRTRVYELIASGDLASVKLGASRRVTIKSIRQLLARNAMPPQRARRAA
jgi:excisionase family DNA binding protein